MKRYAQMRAALAEADLYATVFELVFKNAADQYRQSRAFSASEVCGACEEALARELGEPAAHVRLVLASPSQSSQISPESSLAPVGANRPVESAEIAPTAVRDPSRSDRAVSTANAANSVSDPPPDPLPSHDENTVVRSHIIEHAQSFAGLAGVGDCLRLHAAAPLGFYMDTLPVPGDEESLPPSRQQAWWLLALVAGQFDHSVSVAVPGGLTEADALNPCAFDAEFFGWLVDAHDEKASAFWNVLALVRDSRSSTAACHRMSVPDPARGNA